MLMKKITKKIIWKEFNNTNEIITLYGGYNGYIFSEKYKKFSWFNISKIKAKIKIKTKIKKFINGNHKKYKNT